MRITKNTVILSDCNRTVRCSNLECEWNAMRLGNKDRGCRFCKRGDLCIDKDGKCSTYDKKEKGEN